MRLVFMGTPDFAVPSLRKLAEQHEVVAVVTAPDRPAGRGKKLQNPAVKVAAEELGIPVLQPERLKDAAFLSHLESLDASLFVVVAFRMLPRQVWSMPHKGTINLHASLLPAYRGAAPINWAIINGERETGLSTFFIDEKIDTGAVIEQVKLGIGPDENAGNLHDRMMQLGAGLLLNTVNRIEANEVKSVNQTDMPEYSAEALPDAPKIFRDDCRVKWQNKAQEVHNHIRGLSPYPGAFAHCAALDSDFKLLHSAITTRPSIGEAGSIHVEEGKLYVDTLDKQIEIIELQAPGKRRMPTSDFLRGFQFPNASRFS